MSESVAPLVLESRHTGERLEMARVRRDGAIWLRLRGTLPPHREGPPLHVHHVEAEEGHVLAGTLSAVVDGREVRIERGGSASFPVGSAHRWWNDGDEELAFEGYAGPLVDLDRYLQAVFDVLNAGTPDRPPLLYIAHVAWRHRRTQSVLIGPAPVRAILFPLAVMIGTLLGRYRGSDWPGSPARCREVPIDDEPVA